MVTTAERHQIAIIQPEIKSFLQRLYVMYLQFLIKARHTENIVTAFITGSAQVKISMDNLASLFLPSVALAESGRLIVAVFCRLGFPWAYIALRMDPAAICA